MIVTLLFIGFIALMLLGVPIGAALGLAGAAAIALAKRIYEQVPGAREPYLDFLKKGGSDYPLNLLKKAGVDMSTSAPVESALDDFAQTLELLAQVLKV